jgi:hypothetical protein
MSDYGRRGPRPHLVAASRAAPRALNDDDLDEVVARRGLIGHLAKYLAGEVGGYAREIYPRLLPHRHDRVAVRLDQRFGGDCVASTDRAD